MSNQIEELKRKTEAAFQTIMVIGHDSNFKGMEMDVIWRLIEACIKPIITYGGESWNPTIKEKEEINRIYLNILKRTLKIPVSTPKEVIYIETGTYDVTQTVKRNRLHMEKRLLEQKDEFINLMMKKTDNDSWIKQTEQIKRNLGITEEDMHLTDEAYKKKIEKRIHLEVQNEINKAAEEKSKVKFLLEGTNEWNVGKSKPYMKKLTRNECSTIFRARTRMMNVMNNYKGKYKGKDIKCRICQEEDETQEHILSKCRGLFHSSPTTHLEKVENEEIFTENVNQLRQTARKIDQIMERMESLCSSKVEGRRGKRQSSNPADPQLPLLSRLDNSHAH